jgi:hypothetical protein
MEIIVQIICVVVGLISVLGFGITIGVIKSRYVLKLDCKECKKETQNILLQRIDKLETKTDAIIIQINEILLRIKEIK